MVVRDTIVPVANFSWAVTERRLQIDLKGVLDSPTAKALLADLKAKLDPRVESVVLVTNTVSECPESARKDLVELQKYLAQGRRRSAWVDARPQFRGLALWVMHLSGDQLSKAVSNFELAERWLGSRETREPQLGAAS